MSTMVPTLISLAHSRVLTAFFVHRKLQGSELISYFLASLGDFSWPFVSILTWPLTSIKPFVIGRKNWLFANTPRGARSSAVIYSVIETAKENGLNPFVYLTYLFEQLPNVELSDAALETVMPWSDTLPDACRLRPKKA